MSLSEYQFHIKQQWILSFREAGTNRKNAASLSSSKSAEWTQCLFCHCHLTSFVGGGLYYLHLFAISFWWRTFVVPLTGWSSTAIYITFRWHSVRLWGCSLPLCIIRGWNDACDVLLLVSLSYPSAIRILLSLDDLKLLELITS